MAVIPAIAACQEEMTGWRRHLHAHPELGFQEVETSAFIQEKLKSFGVDEVHGNISETGVVGVIHGGSPGRSIGLRADIDALPIAELSGLSYASRVSGVMHACGHDGHTTMLLGAARYLAQTRRFNGTVYLIFQPAEEIGGAKRVVEEGIFDRFALQQVFGMHNFPEYEEGMFLWRNGPMMASASFFEIVVSGRGAHGAQPHLGIDPIVAASAIVSELQTIVSRNVNPFDAAVVTVGAIHGGTAANAIPDSVTMQGTLRSFAPKVAELLENVLERVVQGAAMSHGAQATVKTHLVAPATVNDAEAMGMGRRAAEAVAGSDRVRHMDEPTMGAEDFSYMLQAKQGAYIALGCKGADRANWNLHHPRYDFNDAVLPIGASYWATLAEQQLGS